MTEQERIENRFRAWYQLATAKQRAEGKSWYREAREFAREIARPYPRSVLTHTKVCGVLAALSPSVAWDINKRQAEALCRAFASDGDIAEVVVSTYGKQAEKAREIVRSNSGGAHIRESIRGILGARAFKTWAFFDNIYLPESQHVTIDQHIIMAADFGGLWVQSAHWCYDLLAEAMRTVARDEDIDLKPHQLQAIIWLTYKETKESAEIPI